MSLLPKEAVIRLLEKARSQSRVIVHLSGTRKLYGSDKHRKLEVCFLVPRDVIKDPDYGTNQAVPITVEDSYFESFYPGSSYGFLSRPDTTDTGTMTGWFRIHGMKAGAIKGDISVSLYCDPRGLKVKPEELEGIEKARYDGSLRMVGRLQAIYRSGP